MKRNTYANLVGSFLVTYFRTLPLSLGIELDICNLGEGNDELQTNFHSKLS